MNTFALPDSAIQHSENPTAEDDIPTVLLPASIAERARDDRPAPAASGLNGTGLLCYGIACYGVFLCSFVYAIAFIGGFALPVTLDTMAPTTLAAIAINVALLGLFAVQHSVMARPVFKRWWTTWIPQAAERSTYVLLSSLALLVLFFCWQPIGGTVWHVEADAARLLIHGVYVAGWLIVLAATCLINHFDLFGLRQVWFAFRGRPYTPTPFVTPWPYRVVRHPLYVGWLIVVWAAPTMTVAHLVFAGLVTAYLLIGIHLEERDLCDAHPEYKAYRRSVPMLIPAVKRIFTKV